MINDLPRRWATINQITEKYKRIGGGIGTRPKEAEDDRGDRCL
jgi:hypothetical protein